MNQAGINLIKKWEGLKLKAYLCSAGVPTLGYGTIKKPDGTKIQLGMICTEDEAEEWLKYEIEEKSKSIMKLIKIPLTDNHLAAIISLTYNIGEGAFAKSTLLKKLNAGDMQGAADQFLVWNKVKDPKTGKFVAVKGLTNRREDERNLFLFGES